MSSDWSKIQSQSIDLLRFPMAVAVVMLHYGTTLIIDATGLLKALCIFFQEGVCRLAVPCFFFISGYLFFQQLQKWDWTVWKKKIYRRIRTLLIPYIIWNLVDLIAYWLYYLANGNEISLAEHFFNVGALTRAHFKFAERLLEQQKFITVIIVGFILLQLILQVPVSKDYFFYTIFTSYIHCSNLLQGS